MTSSMEEEAKAIELPIEAAHVMMFARALGRRDTTWAEAQFGSPPLTFPSTLAQFDPSYELRPRAGTPWFGSGATSGHKQANSGGGTRFHAEQHYTYARPLRVGEVLSATRRPGATWEKSGSRGGVLRFTETITEFLDAEGDLVVTVRGVSVTTSQVVSRQEHNDDQ